MMSRIITLTVAAGAYVLGAKAGRERYEQIVSQARKLWRDPRVQQKSSEATDLVKEQASKVSDRVASSIPHGSKSDSERSDAVAASDPGSARSDGFMDGGAR